MSEVHSEIKQVLRKMDFPHCSKEGLNKISNLLCTRAPSIKQMDLALDLMSEFVFYEVDRRGNKRAPFTPLMELQLLEILYDALNESNLSDSSRNSIFLTLFSGTTATQRLGMLSKLVSIALGTYASKILNSASTWMQQLGNTSANSCKLADNLVTDYFILIPKCLERIQDLPNNSPQFTANFLTAIGELYYLDKQPKFPTHCLLEAVTMWISSDYKLCVAAQIMQSSLPPGAIAMEATTPIAGLLKWTILAPIYNVDDELYAQLHLGILNSLLEIPINPTPRALSTTCLSQANGSILKYVIDIERRAKHEKVDKDVLIMNDQQLQLTMDRYAQAIQVALSVKCVYGNIDEFVNQLQYLPQNLLMKIVVGSYKCNK